MKTVDEAARRAIREELDTSMLVEAGAGSGKTTMLVDRMLGLVARGTPVDRIAAITFTRKAANELRERFQVGIEERIAKEESEEQRKRYEQALTDFESGFVGTIHSFCARLLRERPLQARLDPEFEEVADEDWEMLVADFWRRWVERTTLTNDPMVGALNAVGIEPMILEDAFERVITYPDVRFDIAKTAPPNITKCRQQLESLLDRARKLMPSSEPEGGWDKLMRVVRQLSYRQRIHDWADIALFCDALETISVSRLEPTQKRWSDTKEGKSAAKALGEEFESLFNAEIDRVIRCWREHRYRPVMEYLLAAATAFEADRISNAQLGYSDLLLRAAKLLRENPSVRDELGERYRYVLVDEFQDTDPVQAEVCFLLTSDSSQGNDWAKVSPRAGSLFVVGDPKQSIYRFRRADIQVYDLVRERIEKNGKFLTLVANFRSSAPIGTFVNAHFARPGADGAPIFPVQSTKTQAAFSPMQTTRDTRDGDGVFMYWVEPVRFNKPKIVHSDANRVASWIAAQIEAKEANPQDFLILTPIGYGIAEYARALSARNIPVATTGAPLPQERELSELLVLLRALADPDNAVLVAAALEGIFFGCSAADLFDGHNAGLAFSVSQDPVESPLKMGTALSQMHEWWGYSQHHAADLVIEKIIAETGLLYLAASQELGDAGAGALLHLVEAVRARSTDGASALTDAMYELEVLLKSDAADAPLRPGRTDAVRVMNLHKAKGLEADTVILAAPHSQTDWEPESHIERRSDGQAVGAILITVGKGTSKRILAQPPKWDVLSAEEAEFQRAERNRLLYVATTRPKRRLVVARCVDMGKNGPKPECSAWSPLIPTLAEQATLLQLDVVPAEGRRETKDEPEEIAKRIELADAQRKRAAGISFTRSAVTHEAKATEAQPQESRDPVVKRGLGTAWGRAVHRVIEGMARGRAGETLTRFVTAVARDEGLDEGQVARLASVPSLVEKSPSWMQLSATGKIEPELGVMFVENGGGVAKIVEGVIDAAARGDSGWLIADWKTDDVEDAEWAAREAGYANQIEAYKSAVARFSGENVSAQLERIRLPQ